MAITDIDDANDRIAELEKELADVRSTLASTEAENTDARELLDTLRAELNGLADKPLGTVPDVLYKLAHDIELVL